MLLITLDVHGANQKPIVPDINVKTNINTTLITNILTTATDPDGDKLGVTRFIIGTTSYTAGKTATITKVGTIKIDKLGILTYVPANNYKGIFSLIVVVSDGNYGVTQGNLKINVLEMLPKAMDDNYTAILDADFGFNVFKNDTFVGNDSLKIIKIIYRDSVYEPGHIVQIDSISYIGLFKNGIGAFGFNVPFQSFDTSGLLVYQKPPQTLERIVLHYIAVDSKCNIVGARVLIDFINEETYLKLYDR